MIRTVESLGEFMLFKCQACNTTFDWAAQVSKGRQLVASPDGRGQAGSKVVTIHLKCPACLEKKTYKLWLRES